MKLKKWVKVSFLVLLALVVLVVSLVMAGKYFTEEKVVKENKDKVKVEEKIVEETPPPEKVTTVTKENYDKIIVGEATSGKGGAHIDEVLQLLGEPNDTGESQTGKDTVVKVYTWGKGSNKKISVSFINDYVADKTWIDIK